MREEVQTFSRSTSEDDRVLTEIIILLLIHHGVCRQTGWQLSYKWISINLPFTKIFLISLTSFLVDVGILAAHFKTRHLLESSLVSNYYERDYPAA